MRRRRASGLRPRKQPSQARSRATVAVILEAAARVFASRGYARTTTNHIAAKAGVSIGSLYEYFPSKDALLVRLLEAHLAEGGALLEEAVAVALKPERPLREIVAHLVQAMIDLHARDPRLHQVLFEEAPLPPPLRHRLAEVEQTMAQQIAALLRDHPEVTVPNPELAASILVHAIESLTHRLVVHGAPSARKSQANEMVTLVTSYLTATR